MRRLALPLIALVSLCLLATAGAKKAAPPPVWPGETWERGSPESQGMDSAPLAEMLERLHEDNPGIRSVSVIRNGRLVLDARVAPFTRVDSHVIHSCTKSVVSALIGIAMTEGKLPGVDTGLTELFPGREIAGMDADKRAITLEHLLTMSAGLATEDSYLHDWTGLNEMRQSSDWAQYVLDLPMRAAPGERFEYSNGVAQLLGEMLQDAVGMSAQDYACERLFAPLGIGETDWEEGPPGRSMGYSGLRLRPLDLARIGYLYLRGGEWDGEQLLPRDWVAASTSPRVAAGTMAPHYGYQWWVSDSVCTMLGYGGQFVHVLPEQDLVVVFMSALESGRFFTPTRLLHEYILPAAVSRGPLPENPASLARLDALIAELGSPEPLPVQPLPAAARELAGKPQRFESNPQGLVSLVMDFEEGGAELPVAAHLAMGSIGIRVGLDGVHRRSELLGRSWAFRGDWQSDSTLAVDYESIDRVTRLRTTIHFEENGLRLEIHNLVTGRVSELAAAPE